MAAHNDSKMPGRSAKGKGGIELYSPSYFAACTLGGILACGPTHTCQWSHHRRPLDVTDTHNSCHTVRPRELPRPTLFRRVLQTLMRMSKIPNANIQSEQSIDR